MKTFRDFLEWYKNWDVLPFVEAAEKWKYKFKDMISLKMETYYLTTGQTIWPVLNDLTSAEAESLKRLKRTWWLVQHRAIALRLRKRGFREGATPARRAVEARTRWLGTVTTVTQPAPSWPAVTISCRFCALAVELSVFLVHKVNLCSSEFTSNR